MTTGECIKKRRTECGLTQKELGNLIDVSQQMVAQYENNLRKPKIETLKKIANALNCTTADLDETVYVEKIIPLSFTFTRNEDPFYERKSASLEKLLSLYTKARDNAKEEVVFLTAEIQDLDERIEKLEKKLREKPDTTDPDHK